MGATKTSQYPKDIIPLASLANALAHPARITIVKTLKENPFFRNVDFQHVLQLSPASVNRHLSKLKAIHVVEFSYSPHEYAVKLIPEHLEDLNYFLDQA